MEIDYYYKFLKDFKEDLITKYENLYQKKSKDHLVNFQLNIERSIRSLNDDKNKNYEKYIDNFKNLIEDYCKKNNLSNCFTVKNFKEFVNTCEIEFARYLWKNPKKILDKDFRKVLNDLCNSLINDYYEEYIIDITSSLQQFEKDSIKSPSVSIDSQKSEDNDDNKEVDVTSLIVKNFIKM